jgi:hypothetical protein
MVIIGEAVIDDAVAEARFCCDLAVCKGACCTLEGGRGAPLEDEEVLEINKAYPIVKRYLDERNIRTIEADGLVDGASGDYATACIERRECVFAYFDDGVARCSFEKAYLAGESDWRKPMSCHLFPIRIRPFGKDFVRYETIDQCAAGRKRGEEEQIALHDFLREPLTRKYGEAWYEKFLKYCTTKTTGSP